MSRIAPTDQTKLGDVVLNQTSIKVQFLCSFCQRLFDFIDEFRLHIFSSHLEKCTTNKITDTEENDELTKNETIEICVNGNENSINASEQSTSEIFSIHRMCQTSVRRTFEYSDDNELDPTSCSNERALDGHKFPQKENAIGDEEISEIDDSTTLKMCFICSATFRSQFECDDHKRKYHLTVDSSNDHKIPLHQSLRNLPCKYCDQRFVQKSSLSAHLRTHAQSVECIKCKLCSKSFNHQSGLIHHQKTQHKPNISVLKTRQSNQIGPYKCNECDDRFRNESVMKNHQRCEHLSKRSFDCNVCGKTFAKKIQLLQHSKSHVNNRRQRFQPY